MEVQHAVKFPWAIGKSKSKNITDAISTKVNNRGKTTDCKSCSRSFSSLAQHLRQSLECQDAYDSIERNKMNTTSGLTGSQLMDQDFEFAKPHVEIKEEFPDDQGYTATVS